MSVSPSETLTFLFTDLQDSARQWESSPHAMQIALQHHDTLVSQAIERHQGQVIKTTGDGFYAVFSDPHAALQATLIAQKALKTHPWQPPLYLRARMALHTGVAYQREGDYYGPVINRLARLMSIAHGGQILLSHAVWALLQENLPPDISLLDLGRHRLKDLQSPEHVFQLCHSDLDAVFPPLKSLEGFATNLPLQMTSFIGRERELEQVQSLLKRVSLLTLTGAGGIGKTRLALQVGAEVLETYPDGVWLVELASLGEESLVPQAVGSTLRNQRGREPADHGDAHQSVSGSKYAVDPR